MKKVCFSVFIIYILIVLKLTVFREAALAEREVNLTLFADLYGVYKKDGLWRFLWLFLGNIGWFVPFGFLLPLMTKRNGFLIVLLSGFAFSLLIEIAQFIFRKGYFEIDDLILNTIGVALGYIAYKIIFSKSCAKA